MATTTFSTVPTEFYVSMLRTDKGPNRDAHYTDPNPHTPATQTTDVVIVDPLEAHPQTQTSIEYD